MGRTPGEITTATFSYTNHTLLPEALESWPVALFERAAAAAHADHLRDQRAASATTRARRASTTAACCASISLIDEGGDRRVRMGHLAFVGSHRINGVSALHTELMRRDGVPRSRQRSIPGASSTRPTASSSAAGCSMPIRGLTHAAHEHAAATACSTIPSSCGPASASPTTRASQERYARVKRANKVALGRSDPASGSASRVDPRRAVRCADQAHPRIQAPASQHPRDDRALSGDPARAGPTTGRRASRFSPARRRRAIERAKLIIKLANDVGNGRQHRSARCAAA